MRPRRAKMPPRRAEDAPRHPQDAPRRPQDAPKTPQDAPKTLQDAPKTPQEALKTPPRRPQDAAQLGQKSAPKRIPFEIWILMAFGVDFGGFWVDFGVDFGGFVGWIFDRIKKKTKPQKTKRSQEKTRKNK